MSPGWDRSTTRIWWMATDLQPHRRLPRPWIHSRWCSTTRIAAYSSPAWRLGSPDSIKSTFTCLRTPRPETYRSIFRTPTPTAPSRCSRFNNSYRSPKDPQLLRAKVREVGEHGSERAIGNTEPGAKRSSVLIDGRGWNPASANIGVVWPRELKGRELAVDLAALHRAAQHQMMASPGVIAAVGSGGLKSPAEIGFGEGGYVLGHPEFLGRGVECGQCLAKLLIEI